jgi:hypothetical protein
MAVYQDHIPQILIQFGDILGIKVLMKILREVLMVFPDYP